MFNLILQTLLDTTEGVDVSVTLFSMNILDTLEVRQLSRKNIRYISCPILCVHNDFRLGNMLFILMRLRFCVGSKMHRWVALFRQIWRHHGFIEASRRQDVVEEDIMSARDEIEDTVVINVGKKCRRHLHIPTPFLFFTFFSKKKKKGSQNSVYLQYFFSFT